MQFTIKQARAHAGMTQNAMAKAMKIDRGTYRRIENDITRCTIGQLLAISKITGIPYRDIFLPCESSNEDE